MARKKSSLGCLFYTALVLLVIVLFLFQWNRIREVVESTGFLKHLSLGGSPAPVEKPAGASRPPAAPSPEADGPGTAPNREAPPEPPPASPAGGKPAGDAGGKTGPAEGGPDSRASPPPPAERPAPLPRERAPAAAAPKPAPAARAGGAGRPVSAPAAKPSSVSPAPSAAPLPSAPLPRPPETRGPAGPAQADRVLRHRVPQCPQGAVPDRREARQVPGTRGDLHRGAALPAVIPVDDAHRADRLFQAEAAPSGAVFGAKLSLQLP